MINENTLQWLWKNKKLPIFNGLIFKDGRLLLSELKGGSIEFIKPLGDINLTTLLTNNPEEFVQIHEIGRHEFAVSEYLSFGGGSFGSDGYIGYVVDECIEWLVFFDWSSDFGLCRLIDGDSLLIYQDNYSVDGCLVNRFNPEKIKWIPLQKA